jgi:hypothetical protein
VAHRKPGRLIGPVSGGVNQGAPGLSLQHGDAGGSTALSPALAADEVQASARARSEPVPLLHAWKGSGAAGAIEFHCKALLELCPDPLVHGWAPGW